MKTGKQYLTEANAGTDFMKKLERDWDGFKAYVKDNKGNAKLSTNGMVKLLRGFATLNRIDIPNEGWLIDLVRYENKIKSLFV